MTVGGTTFPSADSDAGRLPASLPGPSTSQEASRPASRDQTHHADHGGPPTSRFEVEQSRQQVGARQRRVGEPAKGSIRPRNQHDRETDQEEHDPGYEQEPCATLWRHGVSVASPPGPWWANAGSPHHCHRPPDLARQRVKPAGGRQCPRQHGGLRARRQPLGPALLSG